MSLWPAELLIPSAIAFTLIFFLVVILIFLIWFLVWEKR